MSLQGKAVIITGASSGIGACLALLLAKEKAKITIVGRNAEKLARVTKNCEKLGGKPLALIADVTKEKDAKKIVEDTVKEYGKIDCLVNNAGFGRLCNIDDKEALEVYDSIMSTNVRAVVHLTHLAVPHLIKSKGSIINISSVAGLKALAGFSAYCMSKAALDHFSRSIALELGRKGVRVNAINPGPVDTDFHINMGLSEEEIRSRDEKVGEATALGRRSSADEVADLIMYLMSEKARGITGACYVLDNGFLLKGNI